MKTLFGKFARGFALAILPISITSAQAPAEFYKGKTVELNIGYSAGGAYDLYARLIARHMGKHICETECRYRFLPLVSPLLEMSFAGCGRGSASGLTLGECPPVA